jgi:hypothetical protein
MLHDPKKDAVTMPERRSFPRYSFTASAEVTDVKSQTRINGRISDLARGGCYVDTISPFIVDKDVKVRIVKDKAWFAAEGRVVYSAIGMGMGLMFTVVEPTECLILEKWIAKLSGEPSCLEANHATVDNHSPEIHLNELCDVLKPVRQRRFPDTRGTQQHYRVPRYEQWLEFLDSLTSSCADNVYRGRERYSLHFGLQPTRVFAHICFI